MSVLKNGRSVCPECFKELDAVIYKEDNAVYMEKKCKEHGKYKVLIERDAGIYACLMNKKPKECQAAPRHLMVSFSHKCNLNCPVCYLPYKGKEIPLEQLKDVISRFEGDEISISGGEPTLRRDLSKLIKFINGSGKKHILLTNGIRFSDEQYVKQLKQAGLKTVHLSLNALDGKVLEEVDGNDMLEYKLKGLENLQKNKIYICLSLMLQRGVNEGQVEKIIGYFLDKPHFIINLRIRSSAPIGRHENVSQLCMSEIVKLLCSAIKVPYSRIVKSINKSSYADSLPCKLCLLLFFQKHKEGANLLFAEVINDDALGSLFRSMPKGLAFGYKLLKHGGIKSFAGYFKNKATRKCTVLMLPVKIHSWLSRYNMELGDISYCNIQYLAENGRVYPFCYAHMVNERRAKPAGKKAKRIMGNEMKC
ncbi:MAG: radical SAM protein [Nanoarchaeota archaeon]|nr:radical SAM protein [Nanoarchaeota archaeon]